MQNSFYIYQRKRFGILLAWGIANVLGGLVAGRHKNPIVKHTGLQAAGWGTIDAALALFGIRGAQAAQSRLERGEIGDTEQLQAAKGFRRILLINAGLDVGYVLGGALLALKSSRDDRKGMGLGIILQGLFLLAYDGLVGLEVGERWLRRPHRKA